MCLNDFQRSWNTVWNDFRFRKCSRKDTTNPIYKLVEVTDKVFPKQNEKVFTCLTARPQKDKQIPFYYINTCLDIRGKKFEREFWRTTFDG